MGLSNYQLVLLDNLIYLNTIVDADVKHDTIGDIVRKLLYNEEINEIGSGTILQDYKNPNKDDDNLCMMTYHEWVEVLRAIEADETLCSLVVHQVANDTSGDTNGFRAMALTNENLDENVIIFRGTTSATEWIDNGKGGAAEETACQHRALEFVSHLDIVNNNSFVVSGHSKGGNLAQYVALFSMEPPIDRCLSFDGQGFSNELCSTPEYQEAIERRGNNLYLIAAYGDCVNVLFNSPVPESHRMYVDTSLILNPLKYHKPNAVFRLENDDELGLGKHIVSGLNTTRTISLLSLFVQDFISYVGKHAPNDVRRTIYDGLMLVMAADADDNDELIVGTEDITLKLLICSVLFTNNDVIQMISPNLYEQFLDMWEDGINTFLNGTLLEILGEGTVAYLMTYLNTYMFDSYINIYNALNLTDFFGVNNNYGIFGEMARSLQDIIFNLIDTADGASIEKFLTYKQNLYSTITTLGEGTKGTFYVDEAEHFVLGDGNSGLIQGTKYNDVIYGGNGMDVIRGGAGCDVLWGGRGDDRLNGGSGLDVYAFMRYDGQDTIYNWHSDNLPDFIVFEGAIGAWEATYEKVGMDLVIEIEGSNRICVQDFFVFDGTKYANAVSGIRFTADGVKLSFQDICARVNFTPATTAETGNPNELTETERRILEEQDEDLREWFADLYHDEEDTDNSSDPDNQEDSNSDNQGDPNPDNTGGSGNDNPGNSNPHDGSAGTTSPDAERNEENAENRAKYLIFGKRSDYIGAKNVRRSDPIIIDLNHDGQFTTSLEEGTYFDLNKDGFAERTAWVGAEDGLLVRDVNGNGRIDNGGELFGDRTVLSNGNTATSGFEALADLDDNGDGILDAQDMAYSELRIWTDVNLNGITDAGELHSLGEYNILSIDLNGNRINQTDANGNLMKNVGNIYGQDANYRIGEYDLTTDFFDTEYRGEEIDISQLEEYLPEIRGCGTLLDLSQAMAQNHNLKQLVAAFLVEEEYIEKDKLIHNILFEWADVTETAADSRGDCIDARKLGVLERLYGEPFIGVEGANPNNRAADVLNRLYEELKQEVQDCLLSQTIFADALSAIRTYEYGDGQLYCDFFAPVYILASQHPLHYITLFVNYLLNYTDLGEHFDRQEIYNQVHCENELWAEYVKAETVVYSFDGVNLRGNSGKDLLLSTDNNENMYGGTGDDVYVFHLGSGQDVVWDDAGNDTIVFGEGITAEDIEVTRDEQNLYLTNRTTGDRVKLEWFFYDMNRLVEHVCFADGTEWSLDDIMDRARHYYGSDGNDNICAYNSRGEDMGYEDDYMYGGDGDDTLNGNNGNDYLYGENGNDSLCGDSGNDVLTGGMGNDLLLGGAGDDVYVFNLGDGQDMISDESGNDTILFGEGIDVEDIEVTRDTYNLYLTNRITGDCVTVERFFYNMSRHVEHVCFADGTEWSLDDIMDRARHYYGSDGNDNICAYNSRGEGMGYEDDYMYGGDGDDTLNGNNGNDYLYGENGNDSLCGGNGNDVLMGGMGNDLLYGGAGDDVYVFNLGDGQDMISEEGGDDMVLFGEGIGRTDLIFRRDGRDLNVSIAGQNDSVRISQYFQYERRRVESFQISDGSLLDYQNVDLMIQAMASFEADTGMLWEDAAVQGNETLSATLNQFWVTRE